MFEKLTIMPPDPILGLVATFLEDSNPQKISLSAGVYQNADGQTPIFSAVKKAEQEMIDAQQTKVYAQQSGEPKFTQGITELILGKTLVSNLKDRVTTIQTPGGCGALHLGAKLLIQTNKKPTVWVCNPTWANHYPLLEGVGLEVKSYAYYNESTKSVDFNAMMEAIKLIPEGDVILMHGCCHNPTGADLTPKQWDEAIQLISERNLLPFIDVAYQGFGESLDTDAYGIRKAVESLPEVMIASSCSKNFGVYRERVGALTVITESDAQTKAVYTQALVASRASYSMPPYHCGGVVGHLLNDPELTKEWKIELESIRVQMNRFRIKLAEGLNDAQSKIDFNFLTNSKGMFCYLGIPKEDILTLRSDYGIYFLESSRINVAALSEKNLPVLIDRISTVLTR